MNWLMLGIILANLNALTLAKFYNPDNPKDMIATVRAKIAETTLRAWFYFSNKKGEWYNRSPWYFFYPFRFSDLCRHRRRPAAGGS
jgi:hypothetical protein